nr:MAG TPA: hypothetical protein [Caudoviricetes sp.]
MVKQYTLELLHSKATVHIDFYIKLFLCSVRLGV